MDYIPPALLHAAAGMDTAFHPPMREPVTAPNYTPPPVDVFSDQSLTFDESRIARANLADIADALGIRGLRRSRGTLKLTIAPGGPPFVVECDTLRALITRAREIHLSLDITPHTAQEAA